MAKKISLGKGRYDARYTKYAHLGLYAVVDDGDFAWLDQYQWIPTRTGRSRTLYAVTRVAGRQVKMHRLIMNAQTGEEIDHWDNNGLNNTRQNLRRCTHQQNITKQRVQMRPKHSVYKGVTWEKRRGKWMAYIKVCGRMKFLGYHPTQEDAARAYDAAAKEAFGEYVWLNFPEATEVLEEG
jgi:hypothetical protein